MAPTRREQLELDELLSDIYLGIESLPDRSARRNHRQQANSNTNTNNQTNIQGNQHPSLKTPSRQQEPQSLASIVTSTTPRRVRIVEPPDKRLREQQQVAPAERLKQNQQQPSNKPDGLFSKSRRPPVKYVNTNKLIYHQERDSDAEDHYRERSYYNQDHHLVTSGKNYDDDDDNNNNNNNLEEDYDDDDDDQFDGKTRVKYYHTTWLDRKLGRLPRRRSSKELTEREIKEKAMIEELKRNLKNGAITLRQSFKGSKSGKNNKSLDFYDLDDFNSFSTSPRKSPQGSSRDNQKFTGPVRSGLATLPRKQQNPQSAKSNAPKSEQSNSINQNRKLEQQYSGGLVKANFAAPLTSSNNSKQQTITNSNAMQSGRPEVSYSRTLPHKRAEHQLLQSHYKGANYSTATYSPRSPGSAGGHAPTPQHKPYSSNTIEATRTSYAGSRSPAGQFQQSQQQQPAQPLGDTISSLPSATEVVRSALSRSGSASSLNQLNKTISLLPNSPSPCAPSPMTPTQQLRAATPTLSPSPQPGSQQHYNQQQQHYNQPVYANPHAALMQHRAEEQARRQGNRNQSSIREFHELDSLLRSLSPAASSGPGLASQPNVGYSSRPAQQQQPASLGFGFANPVSQGPQQPSQPATGVGRLTGQRVVPAPAPAQDLYARVQKQPAFGGSPHANNEQTKASYLQQNYLTQNLTSGRDEFTIDVTNNKLTDENCLDNSKRRQNLSEFEPPIELLPSMEDYQNISKLNPVKNHYWYKPHMSRERAIELLKDKPQGTFIVRDSTSFQGAFGLAVKVSRLPKNVLNNANLRNLNDPSAELIRHFLIEPTPGGVRLKGYANEPIFGSLPALIYQHSLVELALPCKLVIPRTDIEDRNFNMKQKQFYDEFLASKEIAKHMPYEIKSPDGGYRRYPGDVYVHNEHRIIYE